MERPNYYAIIPAEVRYSDIKPNAKLLYGEITALSNKKGFCFASNNYFAELYDVSKNTISLWISELKEAGFISVVIVYENKQVKERRISITNFNGRYHEKKREGITKKKEVNNTRTNTIKNISIRQMKFGIRVSELSEEIQITVEMTNEFLNYWTEPNHSNTKMKWELERTFDIKRRLQRWLKNSEEWKFNLRNSTQKSRIKTTLSAHKKAREMIDKMNNNTND